MTHDTGLPAPASACAPQGEPSSVLIRELHERLLLAEHTPASVVVDEASDIVHASAAAARFLGRGDGDPSRRLLSRVHADLRPALRSALSEAQRTRQTVAAPPVVSTLGDDDDAAVRVRMTVEPLQRPEWPANLTLVVFAQERLPPGDDRMRQVADNMPEFAILTLDAQGRFTSWSRGAERLFGHTEAEALGQPFDMIFTPADRQAGAPAAEMRTARETGRAPDERWHVRKDGTRLFLSGIMTPLEPGGSQGYAKVARDLTERHQRAVEGEAARADAEASAKLKDRFIAVTSHELKQPLNLIHVNAQLLLTLKEARALPAVRKAGETIQRGVAAQSRIIDDLLDLSRNQSGKLQLRLEPLDLAEAMRPSLHWAASKAADKGIAFVQDGFDRQFTVRGDGVRIEQIVWNLLSNAIKFTPAGGRIEVRLQRAGAEAVLEVADDGRGIAPAFLPHVFDMFMQENSSTTRSEGGLGIGLGLVAELVALHGGRVEAQSPGLGRGATFRVRWPLHRPAGPSPLAPPHEAPAGLDGLRILLVEDTPDMLEVFAELLQLEGALVTGAVSAAAAIAACDASAFDLVVSDIGMPGMDGNELIAQLRRRPAMQSVKAIALSGYGGRDDVKLALDAGFDAHLVKPVQMDRFRAAVAGLSAGRPQAGLAAPGSM